MEGNRYVHKVAWYLQGTTYRVSRSVLVQLNALQFAVLWVQHLDRIKLVNAPGSFI